MRRKLYVGSRVYEVAEAGQPRGPSVGQVLTPQQAQALLRRCAGDPAALRVLARFAGGATGTRPRARGAALEAVAERLRRGRLEIRSLRAAVSWDTPVAPAPEPEAEPVETTRERTWIAFRVVDDETGEGVGGVELQIVLPGESSARSFRTAPSGEVRIDDLNEGSCAIEKLLAQDTFELVSVVVD